MGRRLSAQHKAAISKGLKEHHRGMGHNSMGVGKTGIVKTGHFARPRPPRVVDKVDIAINRYLRRGGLVRTQVS